MRGVACGGDEVASRAAAGEVVPAPSSRARCSVEHSPEEDDQRSEQRADECLGEQLPAPEAAA